MTPPTSPAVRLSGVPARVFEHVARDSWVVPPPDERVVVRELTARRYIAHRRNGWIVWTVLGSIFITCLAMLTQAFRPRPPPEDVLGPLALALFGALLLLSAIAWRPRRVGLVAEHAPLDAPRRTFIAEPDALLVESPGGSPRRLRYADVRACEVTGNQTRHGWRLTALTLDDGAGPVTLDPLWLERQRVVVALADRLLRAGSVAVDKT